MKRVWKRRNYFIKQDLQGRYLFLAFVTAVTALVVFALLLGFSQADRMTISYDAQGLHVARSSEALLDQLMAVHWLYIVAAAALVAVAVLFLTHRFAGPIYRFERILEEMLGGNLYAPLVLRTRDEGKELATLINRFNQQLADQVGQMRSATTEIDAALDGLTAHLPADAAELADARRASARLAQLLQYYPPRDEGS